MKLLLILMFLIFASPSEAETRRAVHPSGKTLTLYDAECSRSKPEAKRGKVEMHAATGAVMFVGCWKFDADKELVQIDWDDGDESTVPRSVFAVVGDV